MHKFIISDDGSHTLYHEALNETYHSTHGAIQESQHVFIKMGLDFLEDLSEIKILEIGFGTGLNAFLAVLFQQHNPNKKIEYTTLEPFPIPKEIYASLNFSEIMKVEESNKVLFQHLHDSEWEKRISLSESFILSKLKRKLEDFTGESNYFDVIFFDAFAPNKQEEVWSLENINKCYNALRDHGIFVTYCAQGQLRRNLESVGFSVERLPGPPGKREMLRATK